MTAPAEEALKLQRPLPDHALKIVAAGERKDESPSLLEVDDVPIDLASRL
jgi:hypothetical protein